MSPAPATLRLFVYGTLKQGQSNHLRYFGPTAKAIPSAVRGRLYQLPQGYPILIVPVADVLAIGTANYAADLALQQAISEPAIAADTALEATDAWPLVQGEIIEFTDAHQRLPRIDTLEGFDASTGQGLYQRVLIWTVQEPRAAVWTYVAPEGAPPPGAIPWGLTWP